MLHHVHGLLVDVGENDPHALLGALVVQCLQRVECRHVQRVDHVHPDDKAPGKLLDGDLPDVVGHAEEQRPADLIHPHVQRHLGELILRHVLVLPAPHLRLVAHALHEQQCRQQHPHLDGHHQIEDDRQQKRQHQHQNVALGGALAEPHKGTPLTHIIRHAEQDGGDAGHRDQRGVGHQHHQHQHQHGGVDHPRHRRGLDVGGGAGDRPRSGDTAEQRGAYVADTLRDQLRVGVVVRRHHAVRHHAGEQALNGGQDRDGKRAWQHTLHRLKGERRHRERRQPVGDGIEVADGVHRQIEKLHHGDAHQHGDKAAGDQLIDPRPDNKNGEAHRAHRRRPQVHRVQTAEEARGLLHGLNGPFCVADAEKVLPLPNKNRHGDTGGEPRGDGVGDKAYQAPQLQNAHQNEDDTRHDGGDRQPAQTVLRHDPRHNGGKGGGGSRDLHPAAAEAGDQEPRHNGGVNALLRADAAGESQRDGQGQRDDSHDNARNRVLGELLAGIGLQAVEQRGGENSLMHKVPLSSVFAAEQPFHHSPFPPLPQPKKRRKSFIFGDFFVGLPQIPSFSVCPLLLTFRKSAL